MKCTQPGCTGEIADGYCDVCGMAPARGDAASASAGAPASASVAADAQQSGPVSAAGMSDQTVASPGAGRRAATTRTRPSGRSPLGAGLVEIPSIESRDPSAAVLAEPSVPESRRFCGRCDAPVGRARDGEPGRAEGFCRKCGAPFSFAPKLLAGDVVAGQYEVAGCLAHGGMGWVYLARDRNVSDRWVVLKGLLNTGDDDAMTAALAERRFLAEVEHEHVVKIYNFVQHENSGYIVMEFVGGQSLKQILAARRERNGGEPDPLPVAQAIAYMIAILPALGYLHGSGLLFCDFKLDNVIQTGDSLKLIDLGGVYRIDEPASAVFGTVGYQAPEIATVGPSVSSDLFTVARTLAIMCLDFRGYQGAFKFTLPPPESAPPFARYDSLYRFLLKGTAPNPDDRFQSAEEMREQLLGVLREVVADEQGSPVAAPSTLFTESLRGAPEQADWRLLPRLRVSTDDTAELRLAAAMTDGGDWAGLDECLGEIEAAEPWEWRTSWYRGIAALAREDPVSARASLTTVYEAVPGELAPKLALGVACELAGELRAAAAWYEIVSRTDNSYTSASFGLARRRLATGDRDGAVAAYDRVPDTSSAYTDAQTARIRCLGGSSGAAGRRAADLLAAGANLEALSLGGEQRIRLGGELLESALALVQGGGLATPVDAQLLGCRLVERDLRGGLEQSYRSLARYAPSSAERYRLVDQANQVRPRTWT
jgi:serine/threonine-protein kinase PknG